MYSLIFLKKIKINKNAKVKAEPSKILKLYNKTGIKNNIAIKYLLKVTIFKFSPINNKMQFNNKVNLK